MKLSPKILSLSILCCLFINTNAYASGVLDPDRPLIATSDVIPAHEGPLGMVDVAPYGGLFPLTAIINKANHPLSNVKVTVLGKGEKGIPISYDVGAQAINTHNGIPVFGLYPDYVNKVKVDWVENGKKQTFTWSIYAAPVSLPATTGQTAVLPTVEPVKVAPSLKNRNRLI